MMHGACLKHSKAFDMHQILTSKDDYLRIMFIKTILMFSLPETKNFNTNVVDLNLSQVPAKSTYP